MDGDLCALVRSTEHTRYFGVRLTNIPTVSGGSACVFE